MDKKPERLDGKPLEGRKHPEGRGPGHGPVGPDGKPLPSPYEMKMAILHKGPCSSPRVATCPCPRDCPLHGRCCDCTRHHIEERKMLWDGMDEERRNSTEWLPECLRLAQLGDFR